MVLTYTVQVWASILHSASMAEKWPHPVPLSCLVTNLNLAILSGTEVARPYLPSTAGHTLQMRPAPGIWKCTKKRQMGVGLR